MRDKDCPIESLTEEGSKPCNLDDNTDASHLGLEASNIWPGGRICAASLL